MVDKGWTIGVDIGATKTVVGLLDPTGKIVKQDRSPTHVEKGPEAIIQEIVKIIKESVDEPIDAIGVAVAGQIDSKSGVVLYGPNLHWKDVPLKELISTQLKIPTFVFNDVQSSTWGEWKYGAGQGTTDLVGLFVGTGIGGGLILNDKLFKGYTNSAGEVGHMTVDLRGPKCSCGNHGCLEAYAGGWALAHHAKHIVATKPWKAKQLLQFVDGNSEKITARTVGAAYLVNEPVATKIVNDATAALIAATVTIVNLLNPQRVIFGGGVIEGLPMIVDRINVEVRKKALRSASAKLEVMKAFLPHAAVNGASALAKESLG